MMGCRQPVAVVKAFGMLGINEHGNVQTAVPGNDNAARNF
jgi:hypothetical protein